MIGAAVQLESVGGFFPFMEEYGISPLFGTIDLTPDRIEMVAQAIRKRSDRKNYLAARPNVTGQRQTKCIDFPDIQPDQFGPGKQLAKGRTMIGNTGYTAVGCDNFGDWSSKPAAEYEVITWLGGYVRHGQKEQVTTAIIAACRKARSPYPIGGAVPNVTGPRQTKCHDFPDVEPDDPETPVLDDVETLDNDPPLDTVDCADSPRQETVPYLVWGAMQENTVISDMVGELQPHDRDDLRQDMAVKYWRKAVRQELRGDRIQGLTRWLMADVRQWIGERTDIATSEPLTKQQIDDAKGDTLLLQRSASEESRLEKLEHDLRIEQSRFAAEIEAKHRATSPKAILTLKW